MEGRWGEQWAQITDHFQFFGSAAFYTTKIDDFRRQPEKGGCLKKFDGLKSDLKP